MSSDPDPTRFVAIDVSEPCAAWRARLPDVERCGRAAAEAALAGAGVPLRRPAELSVVLADDAMVRELNRAWRGQDRPTNVLSFAAGTEAPPPGAPLLLGDVVLAFETVAAEAAAQSKPLADHLRHLVVHGVLHLLGFDHDDARDAEAMEALETKVLSGLGVPDPYEAREACDG